MKLLLLTSGLPWPLEIHGGAQRTTLLLEAMRSFAEVDIAFVSWSEESVRNAAKARDDGQPIVGIFHVPNPDGASAGGLARLPMIGKPFQTVHGYLGRYSPDPSFSTWLEATLRDGGYDGVVSRFLWPGAVGNLAKVKGVRKVLDWDDLDHIKIRSQIAKDPWKGLRGAISKGLVLSKLKTFCLAEARSYDHVWVVKTADVAASTAKSVSILPNIPFMEEAAARAPADRADILFIGNLTYLPNSDALTGFLESAWPQIHRKCPAAKVLAVGPRPFPEVEHRWARFPGVEIVGAVPSLAPYYDRAALSICPVEWGGGSNIKAIESLGHGVPCVVSPYTYDAFKEDFTASTGMICAQAPDDYARACIDLLNNVDRSLALGDAGRKVVEARYSRQRFQGVVRSALI